MTDRMIENAHKLTFLVEQYPKKTLEDFLKIMVMPAIDMNVAIWSAMELGFIKEPDPKTGKIEFIDRPDTWKLGIAVEELEARIVYGFEQMATRETDLEEHHYNDWTAGHHPMDIMIVTKRLLNSHILAEYAIEDGENTYKFYTLYRNKDHIWGNKQFKVPPIKEKKTRKKKDK